MLIHTPILQRAGTHPEQVAITLDAHGPHARSLSFGELHARASAHAARLRARGAPATCLVGSPRPPADAMTGASVTGDATGHDPRCLLTALLGTLITGRCAAVADADWPEGIRRHIAESLPRTPHDDSRPPSADDPFYIGFTSGSTGLPKGFRRSHRSWTESFRVTLQDFGPEAAGPVLAPGRLSHSLFLFGALLGLYTGSGVFLQSRFSATGTLLTLRQHGIPVLIAVPGQLQMLIAAARHQRLAPIPGLRLILISGARWAHEYTPALQALFPDARILCFYGASETSYISWMPAAAGTAPSAVGRPFSNVQLHIGPDPRQPPHPPGEPGLIWLRSPMLFCDYINAGDGTAALRIGDWISVRDIGHLDDDGILHLDGRENRMIVSQARNIFPEEIESRLIQHPGIAHASVHGLPDPGRSMVVHAVVGLPPACPTPSPSTSAASTSAVASEFATTACAVSAPATGAASACSETVAASSTADTVSTSGNGAPSASTTLSVPATASASSPRAHATPIPLVAAATATSAAPLVPAVTASGPGPHPRELAAWCRQSLESWKAPRHWWIWQGMWPQTASGKTDHARIASALHEHLAIDTANRAGKHDATPDKNTRHEGSLQKSIVNRKAP